jgi:biopolymer transport protein ExbD
MDFSDPPRRRPPETLLPMINVVFLLLIFFLISARMTPPDPFAVTPPEALAQAEAQGAFTLYLAADGRVGYRDRTADAALTAVATARADHCARADCTVDPPRLTLRADAAMPATQLAALLPRLADLGFAGVDLVVSPGVSP